MFLCNCQANLIEMLQTPPAPPKIQISLVPSAELKEIIGFLKAHPLEKWKEYLRDWLATDQMLLFFLVKIMLAIFHTVCQWHKARFPSINYGYSRDRLFTYGLNSWCDVSGGGQKGQTAKTSSFTLYMYCVQVLIFFSLLMFFSVSAGHYLITYNGFLNSIIILLLHICLENASASNDYTTILLF